MWEYSEKVREHYLNPRNVGDIENPDGVGEVGNLKCGDALRLTFKLDDDKKISDIKFKTFGCGSAIASSSMLTELVKGKSIEEAESYINNLTEVDAVQIKTWPIWISTIPRIPENIEVKKMEEE